MYEIVSDMSSRQDSLDEHLGTLEDKLVALQEQLELLPDLIANRIQAHVSRGRTPSKPISDKQMAFVRSDRSHSHYRITNDTLDIPIDYRGRWLIDRCSNIQFIV